MWRRWDPPRNRKVPQRSLPRLARLDLELGGDQVTHGCTSVRRELAEETTLAYVGRYIDGARLSVRPEPRARSAPDVRPPATDRAGVADPAALRRRGLAGNAVRRREAGDDRRAVQRGGRGRAGHAAAVARAGRGRVDGPHGPARAHPRTPPRVEGVHAPAGRR